MSCDSRGSFCLLRVSPSSRCFMHAFSLLTGSILGHDYASGIVGDAQRLVTFFRASHMPYTLLKALAAELKCKSRTLQPSSLTRFTPVYSCLLSVYMQNAFKRFAEENGKLFPAPKGYEAHFSSVSVCHVKTATSYPPFVPDDS